MGGGIDATRPAELDRDSSAGLKKHIDVDTNTRGEKGVLCHIGQSLCSAASQPRQNRKSPSDREAFMYLNVADFTCMRETALVSLVVLPKNVDED